MPVQWNLIRKSQSLRVDSEHFGMNTALSGLTVIDVDVKNGKNGLQYLKEHGIDLDDPQKANSLYTSVQTISIPHMVIS